MLPDPLFNIPPWYTAACDACITNASAHVAWAALLPLAGHQVSPKHGALIAGGAWIAWTLAVEWPTHQGAAGSEIRTDLLTRIVPALAVMLWEALK